MTILPNPIHSGNHETRTIAPGLRARDLFTNGTIDYVCTDCVTIVLDPTLGCPACTTRRENKDAKKRAFFQEMEAARERQRAEDARLRAEALSGLEVEQ